MSEEKMNLKEEIRSLICKRHRNIKALEEGSLRVEMIEYGCSTSSDILKQRLGEIEAEYPNHQDIHVQPQGEGYFFKVQGSKQEEPPGTEYFLKGPDGFPFSLYENLEDQKTTVTNLISRLVELQALCPDTDVFLEPSADYWEVVATIDRHGENK